MTQKPIKVDISETHHPTIKLATILYPNKVVRFGLRNYTSETLFFRVGKTKKTAQEAVFQIDAARVKDQ